MKNDVEISEVLKALDKELSESKLGTVQNKAINKGAVVVAEKMKTQLSRFSGTKLSKGYSGDEVVIQKSRKTQNGRESTIGWNGPKDRYRLIHLNEWGYTKKGKKYRPRLQGTVTESVKDSEKEYLNIVHGELRKAYGG